MQEEKTAKAPIKIYAIGALALVSIVGGVIYFNADTTSISPQPIVVVTPEPTEAIIPQTTASQVIAPQEPMPDHVDPEPASLEPTTNVVEEVPAAQTQAHPPHPKQESEPLPKLDDSDELAINKAATLSWLPVTTKQLIKKDLIRNFVTFVDNVSRGDLATKFSPIIKPKQKFSIDDIENEMYISQDSYKRYDVYVDIVNSLNLDMAINALTQLMPLLDEAYMELGYEKGAFVTTLSLAIDEMLDAPVIRNPIKLVAPSAMYKYADPQLENLSDVQKLMIRMGPDNITKLRPKLQQLQLSLSQLIEAND